MFNLTLVRGPGRIPGIDGLTLSSIALRSMELLDDVIRAMRRVHQPVIAAVNGPAIGGGLCLSLAADIRLGADTALFRAAGINNGLTASELGLSYLLPRAVGSSRAFEIMLSGRDVDAAEAERIAAFSRPGTELTKRMLWSSLDAASLDAHMGQEGLAQLYVRLTTRNFEEAIQARKENRPPDFQD